MLKGNKISILIPALNEVNSIRYVIKDIPKDIADEIIVIDNGSEDNTSNAAVESGAKVVYENRGGYGAACLKGIENLDHPDVVVILDADYSDYPEQMHRLLNPIVNNEADFVIGSRILGNREEGALAPQAYWGNNLAVFLIWLLFKYKFTDMGPFRAIRYESLKRLNMRDKGFGWNAEMQIKAVKLKLRIKEVPVDYRRRIGISKISGTITGTIKSCSKIIFTIFRYFFRYL